MLDVPAAPGITPRVFELLKTDSSSKARLGRLTTAHGVIDTPVFMPVGTQASVKAIDPRELDEMGTQILLGNTYHLNIRPGMEIIKAAVERTIRWAKECLEQPRAKDQMVFGIVQGGSDAHLRERCAKEITSLGFDGYAIGGVSVGEPEHEMMQAVELTEPHFPADQPRYAMGLGTPAQMVELIARGVDMFDCVLPTRVARNGTVFTYKGAYVLKGGQYKADFRPIEEGCDCFACQRFTRAYLRHLFNVGEILGARMLSVHNSHMFLRVMRDVRTHLAAGTFSEFRHEFIAHYVPSRRVLATRLQER